MKKFRDQLEKDLEHTFFNPSEFAELHLINQKETPIIIDNDTLMALNLGKNSYTDGIFEDSKLFFVQKKDLDFEPVVGQIMDLDGEMYQIGNVTEDMGGYSIVLRGNES